VHPPVDPLAELAAGLSGYDHPADPIGPEPATGSPDLCAAWHEALAALSPVDGPDVRGMPDGRLLHLCDTYPIETAWAPPWVSDELRQARAAARDARLASLRATAEAAAAHRQGQHEQGSQQQALAASYQAMHDAYCERETVLAVNMTDRADWEQATRHQRQLAVAADTELRRRHPGEPWPPLRSAEPEAATELQHDSPATTPDDDLQQAAQRISELAARHREFADKLAQRQSLMVPAEDLSYEDLGPAFPAWAQSRTDAILQPPRPQIPPPGQILERIADRDMGREAGG
jgi:hypothetical protein